MSKHNRDPRRYRRGQTRQPDVSALEQLAKVKCVEQCGEQAERLLVEGRREEAQAALVRMVMTICDGGMSEAEVRESLAGWDGECVPGLWAWMARAVAGAGVPVAFALVVLDLACIQQGAGTQGLPAGALDEFKGLSKEKLVEHMDQLEASGLVKCEDNGDGTQNLTVLVRLV